MSFWQIFRFRFAQVLLYINSVMGLLHHGVRPKKVFPLAAPLGAEITRHRGKKLKIRCACVCRVPEKVTQVLRVPF
jgi:hypothetical protein